MEGEWSFAMSDIVRRKTSKLNSKGFEKFTENWLLIYDNLPLIYDVDSDSINLSCSCLINDLEKYWSVDSFDKIFVETGSFIIEFKEGNFTKLELNDIWKRR